MLCVRRVPVRASVRVAVRAVVRCDVRGGDVPCRAVSCGSVCCDVLLCGYVWRRCDMWSRCVDCAVVGM